MSSEGQSSFCHSEPQAKIYFFLGMKGEILRQESYSFLRSSE
jgi:hypothetical protein